MSKLNEAKSNSPRAAIDVEFIKPFIIGTKNALETQANTQITAGSPFIKRPGDQLSIQVAGVIAITNPAFSGTITICFRDHVFLKIYENMVGERHTSISPEVADAAAEMLNIIFGQAKTILNDKKGHTLEKALPTVLTGDKLSLRHQESSTTIVLPFESSAGAFHLEVSYETV